MEGTHSAAPLDVKRLRRILIDQGPYNRLDYSEATGSTNSDLIEAADDAPDWTIAVTDLQEAGKGRLGRSFVAPSGAQAIQSVLFRPPASRIDALGTVPLASGLAVIDALREVASPGLMARAGLKWPNDVLIDARKLCGILVEAVSLGDSPALVVGIGLNVSLKKEELPVPHATSLLLEGDIVDRTDLIVAVVMNLHRRLTAWSRDDRWLDDYRAVCTSIGKDVRVVLPGDRELLGRAIGVTDTGQLEVRDNSGTVHALNAGDVTHLRLQ